MTVTINPTETEACKARLEALLADTSCTDALNNLKTAGFSASTGLVCADFTALVNSYEQIAFQLDVLIQRTIVLLGDTQTYFVETDEWLASEISVP